MTERVDVLVVGAGLSGIDAAYRLQTECPDRGFVILEAREAMGGTWDLFRYPGVRSDSDMFTLGFPFRPWRRRPGPCAPATARNTGPASSTCAPATTAPRPATRWSSRGSRRSAAAS